MIPRLLVLPYARWHAARPHVREVAGRPLLVLPGVFDPVLTKVGAWLARAVAPLVRPGERWLDLGTGSGVVALALARAGAHVVATDVDETACRNASLNAALSGLRLDVRQGDLFAPVQGEQFDGVVGNLPFWPRATGVPVAHGFAAGPDYEILRRFVEGAPAHAPRCLTVLSERFDDFGGARAALGPAVRLVRRQRHRGEWMNLFELDRRPAATLR